MAAAKVFKNKIPVIDHMWQTETSGPVFGNPYGLGMLPIKPGSSTVPMPGIDAEVVQLDGTPCGVNEKGIMVIKRPFPGLTPALWGEKERYGRDYWQIIPACLLHRRFGANRRGRLCLVCWSRRRDHQNRRTSHRHHRS